MIRTLGYIKRDIQNDLAHKMVFVGGPRQVGKTTLALQFLKDKSEKSPAYLNWDRASDRRLIIKDQMPLSEPVIIFDEIHKYRNCR